MKTIFNKSLVALALIGSVATANAAVTFGGSGLVISKTGLDLVSGLASGNSRYISTDAGAAAGVEKVTPVSFQLGSAAPVGTLIRVDFSVNFKTGTTGVTNSLTATPAAGALTVFQQGANFVVYQVTTAIGAADSIALNALAFNAADVRAAGGLKVTVAAENGTTGASVVASETKQYWEIKSQYDFAVTKTLSRTIDVATKRTKFTDGTSAVTNAVLKIVDSGAAATVYDVTFNTHKFVVTGDFAFLVDTDTKADNIQTNAVTLGAGCTLSHVKATEIKFGCSSTPAGDLLTIDLDQNATDNKDVYTTLNTTDFKLSSEYIYSGTVYGGLAGESVAPFASAGVGSWTLNGSDVTIPYMVYGNVGGKEYNQVIQLTNKSSIEGAIYVDIFDGEGKQIAKAKKLTAVSKANSVTNIATEIKAIVAEAKYAGKVSVRVVSEVPSSSAQIYAAYQDVATSERAIVVGLTK